MSSIAQRVKLGEPLDDILILDCHNHLGPFGSFHIPEHSAESMIASMDNLGVNKVFVTASAASIGPDYRYGNDLVIEAISDNPERMLGYVTINPHYPSDMMQELDRCFAYDRIKGIKLHPSWHQVALDYKCYDKVYDYAEYNKCPVLIHVWGAASATIVDKLASRYNNIKFIMGHGGADKDGMQVAVEILNKYDNVYVDIAISLAPQGNIEWFVQEVGAGKVLYGSDMPFYDPRHTFGRVALADISEEEKRQIFGLNLAEILSVV